MKTQYILGTKMKDFIRLYDTYYYPIPSQSLEEVKEMQKMVKKSKIYKLIEIKK